MMPLRLLLMVMLMPFSSLAARSGRGSSAVRPETLLQLLPAAAVQRDVFRQLHRRAGAARGFHAGSAFACQLARAAAPAGDVEGVIGAVLAPADRQRGVRRQHIDVILAGEQVFERA